MLKLFVHAEDMNEFLLEYICVHTTCQNVYYHII